MPRDFGGGHPEFQPVVLIRLERRAAAGPARRARRRGRARTSNLKFPHALHLDPRGGAAQMGAAARARATASATASQCADCHVPTPDGTRFQPVDMEDDCGMCHSLAFDQIGGTIRTLRHGSPAQVIGDLRALYRAGGPQRPAELAAGARAVPGDVARIRAARPVRPRPRQPRRPRRPGDPRASSRAGGACFDCHEVDPAAARHAQLRHPPGRLPDPLLLHGWFDHRAHQIVQRPGQPRLDGSAACASCHNAPRSSAATDLLLPDLASCRTCHGGERTRLPVASSCAMCHDYHMDGGTPGDAAAPARARAALGIDA